MAGKRKRGEVWEYVVKRAGLLEKPIYLTFADESHGDSYVARLEALLDRGIIPTEHQTEPRIANIAGLVRQYLRDAHPSSKDDMALAVVVKRHGTDPLASINAAWVDVWISEMKRVEHLAPASIRARVGALARCTDWGVRKGLLTLPDNPLRTLPDGYAQYTKLDAEMAGGARVDVERDRRLEPGEYDRIIAMIDGGVLPRAQRPLTLEFVPAMRFMFILALESAMRMREIYTLTTNQVDRERRTVFLDKTKNGDKRQVPLTTVVLAEHERYMASRTIPEGHQANMLFPWCSSSDASLRTLAGLSDRLSRLFADSFEAAGCVGLRFHDLRHEATCRLFERTTLGETQIMKITGHKSHRMLMRYANLRGSDLAKMLW